VTWIVAASVATVAALLAMGFGDGRGFMVTASLVTWVFVAVFTMRDWLSAQLHEVHAAHEVSVGLIMQQVNSIDREVDKLGRAYARLETNQTRMIQRLDHMAEEMGVDPVKLAEDRVNFARQRGNSAQAFASQAALDATDPGLPANVLKLRTNN
jgi:hypothetical protein